MICFWDGQFPPPRMQWWKMNENEGLVLGIPEPNNKLIFVMTAGRGFTLPIPGGSWVQKIVEVNLKKTKKSNSKGLEQKLSFVDESQPGDSTRVLEYAADIWRCKSPGGSTPADGDGCGISKGKGS